MLMANEICDSWFELTKYPEIWSDACRTIQVREEVQTPAVHYTAHNSSTSLGVSSHYRRDNKGGTNTDQHADTLILLLILCVMHRPDTFSLFLVPQVVHHPTIMAAYCEGRTWIFEGDGELRSKFWGRSIELQPVGICKLTFHDGESFSWQKITTSINNLILGRLYVDHGGIMRIRSSEGGLVAKVRFKEAGTFSKEVHQVRVLSSAHAPIALVWSRATVAMIVDCQLCFKEAGAVVLQQRRVPRVTCWSMSKQCR